MAQEIRLSNVIGPAFWDIDQQIINNQVSEAVFSGGRGSLKSSNCSLILIYLLLQHPACHAVVARRVANTLRTSVYAQVCWAISALGLDSKFKKSINPLQITYKKTGQTIYFFGMDDPGKLKSIKVPFGYIGLLWFEELDQFKGPEEIRNAEQSILRGEGEWFMELKSFNPPATIRNWANQYVKDLKKGSKTGAVSHHSTYLTTPPQWLGRKFLDDAKSLKETDETAYRHEYLGEIVGTGTSVFTNIESREITNAEIRTFDRVYRGVDWGFYPDPFAYNECQYFANRRELWIFGELTARRLDNVATANMIKARKKRSELIICDSAEPKSILDYKSMGLPAVGAKKGPGSVEHGMKWLQGLKKIVIDPVRCPDTEQEFLEYEYAVDRNGIVIDGYPDFRNHHIDAVRYAVERVSTRKTAKVAKR